MGGILDCVRCDRSELPEDFVGYKRSPDFTEETLPAGLRADHKTAKGVWAKINVQGGQLRYRVAALAVDMVLTPGRAGIVVPQVPHNVEPSGTVRFFIEFYRAATPLETLHGRHPWPGPLTSASTAADNQRR